MEEDSKKILEENLEISRESLKILKGIRRSSRISAAFRIVYWLVVLAALAGAYYFIQPYLGSALEIFQQIPGANALKIP